MFLKDKLINSSKHNNDIVWGIKLKQNKRRDNNSTQGGKGETEVQPVSLWGWMGSALILPEDLPWEL